MGVTHAGKSHDFILMRQEIMTRRTFAVKFEVFACRLVGENARAISRNQATFSYSSLPGSTVRRRRRRRTDAKEASQASRPVFTTRQ